MEEGDMLERFRSGYCCLSILVFPLVIALFSDPVLGASPLKFSASVREPFSNSQNSGFEDRLLQELFSRLNQQVHIKFVPAERAMINLNDGLDDGCLSRINGLQSLYPNIRQIDEVSLVRDFMVFSRDPTFKPEGWNSLAPYHVGIITGWKILERNVTSAKSITKVKNGELLFNLLDLGRAEVVIYNRWGGLYIVRELGLEAIHPLEPPLTSVDHYFYLNKKHENLLEPAARALADMKQDGTYQRILNESFQDLVKK